MQKRKYKMTRVENKYMIWLMVKCVFYEEICVKH